MLIAILTPAQQQALARVALREDRAPPWVADLALLPEPNFHAFDHLVHEGLVAWRTTGWRITEAGWLALTATRAKDEDGRCPERQPLKQVQGNVNRSRGA